MTLSQAVLSALVGVIASLVAAALYFRYAYSLKPDLSISDTISKWETSNGETKYSIKIVNNTNRAVIRIGAEFCIVKLLKVAGPTGASERITESTAIRLVKDRLMILEGCKSKVPFAPYEFRFYTLTDIEALLRANPQAHLAFRIFGTDEKTGFSRVFEKTYSGLPRIQHGPFKAAHSLEVELV